MPEFFEKRMHPRHLVQIPIRYDVAETGAHYSGEIINLSKFGVYMTAPASLDIGDNITFHINSSRADKDARVKSGKGYAAVVKSCHIQPKSGIYTFGIGVELQVSLPQKEWSTLYAPTASDTRLLQRTSGPYADTLRQRAEDFLSCDPQAVFRLKPDSIQQLVHELYIHQVELQMQGDELRQAQAEIQTALSRYADLYDFAPVGYFTLDPVGVIEKVNITGAAMLGAERSRLVQKPISHHILERDQDIFRHHRLAVIKSRKQHTCEIRFRSRSGEIVYAQLQSILEPISDGAGNKVFTAMIDITDRKQAQHHHRVLEKRLAEAKKLEAVGTLAGGVAHDFNNLMTAIQGSVSVMRMDLGDDHPHAHYLASIDAEIRSAANLTRQLLAFARGGKYEVRPVDINTMIHTTAELFSRTHRSIDIQTDLQASLDAVAVDQSQIEQALLNLFINAGDAMPNGGSLEIRTKGVVLNNSQTRPHHLPEGDYIHITVSDSGSGMDKATRTRIFEPFFSTKKHNRGTGLGLASAYGTIRNHHGFIEVDSIPGKGTTFDIFLPITLEKAVEPADVRPNVQRGTETILFVDDEPKIRKMVSDLLEHLGYTVLLAAGGGEAIERYRTHRDRIDLVMLDMTMPGMDGSQTFEGLKALDADVRVLLASGYSRQGKAEEIVKRGCRGFIQKPFTLEKLSTILREILDPS